MEIEGAPAIRQYAVLSDKRHILTKDTKGYVQIYDALKVRTSLLIFLVEFISWIYYLYYTSHCISGCQS